MLVEDCYNEEKKDPKQAEADAENHLSFLNFWGNLISLFAFFICGGLADKVKIYKLLVVSNVLVIGILLVFLLNLQTDQCKINSVFDYTYMGAVGF
jgi:hypothetical protein